MLQKKLNTSLKLLNTLIVNGPNMTSYDLYHELPVQATAGHGEAAELQPGLQQEEQHCQQRRAQHRLQGGYRGTGQSFK